MPIIYVPGNYDSRIFGGTVGGDADDDDSNHNTQLGQKTIVVSWSSDCFVVNRGKRFEETKIRNRLKRKGNLNLFLLLL